MHALVACRDVPQSLKLREAGVYEFLQQAGMPQHGVLDLMSRCMPGWTDRLHTAPPYESVELVQVSVAGFQQSSWPLRPAEMRAQLPSAAS